MRLTRTPWLAGVLLAASMQAGAQGMAQPPQNVLHLSAQGAVETQQDLLTMTLTTSRDGPEPAAVQAQLKAALDTALNEARKTAQPGQMDVRTGNFALYPRNGRDGKLTGWQGSVELVLEGRDFQRITQTAGRIQTMTLGGVSFGLSRDQRARAEAEAQTLAIERFKTRATELARSLGFAGYTLREVTVAAGDQVYAPRVRMLAMEAKAAVMDQSVPVEAGKAAVTVTVSGSVQLR